VSSSKGWLAFYNIVSFKLSADMSFSKLLGKEKGSLRILFFQITCVKDKYSVKLLLLIEEQKGL